MADKYVRFIPGKWADYVKKLLAGDVESPYNTRVNFYKTFSRLSKNNPKKYRMHWFGGWIMYEESRDKGKTWDNVSGPADHYDEVRCIAIDEAETAQPEYEI